MDGENVGALLGFTDGPLGLRVGRRVGLNVGDRVITFKND